MNPVFIISLPRSGSTLLQKMLAVSPEVCTTAEPWVCLPMAAMLDPTAIASEYWHTTCHQALTDFMDQLPGGREEYLHHVAGFLGGLYSSVGDDSRSKLFLDKTPRYYLITEFLAEVFPEARFIFLFRHPLEVLSSILKTWNHDRFSPRFRASYIDLMRGPALMAQGVNVLGDRVLCLTYEDLVSQPEASLRLVCEYLDISYMDGMLTAYRSIELSGSMGDPDGAKSYQGVSGESREKWKSGLSNAYRKWFARRYVRYLGDDSLNAFGLSVRGVLEEIDNIPTTFQGAITDAIGYSLFTAERLLNHLTTGEQRRKCLRKRPYLPYG